METEKTMLLSVVIPAFREAAGIALAISAIDAALADIGMEWEIVVVDDGSPDGTFEEVRRIANENPRVRGLRLSRNFGKEAAILAGLRAANGDCVVTIDADLQHPPELIPQMVAAWLGGVKVVNAVKRNRGDESAFSRARADVFNALISRLSGVDLRNSSDFKLLDREVVRILVESLPEKMRFYRGLAQWIGFAQTDVYFDVNPRKSGASSWSTRALLKLALTALVSFTSAPLRIVTVLGVCALIVGSVIAVDALWSWINHRAVSGFATIIITLLFLGSTIMISLGIIGEYIAKVYDEIKRRPSYLVAATCGRSRSAVPVAKLSLPAQAPAEASDPQTASSAPAREIR